MRNSMSWAFVAALAVPAAWAATTIDPSAAPNGTHVQSGTPGCTESGFTVTCNSFDLAGVGNKDATANLVVTYTGTVLCINPAGNVAPGQTQNPMIPETTGKLEPKNGRLTVPELTSATQTEIENALMLNTKCPNRKWTKSVQTDTIAIVGFTYTVTFTGFKTPYITITG
jgi:hypothetical protein